MHDYILILENLYQKLYLPLLEVLEDQDNFQKPLKERRFILFSSIITSLNETYHQMFNYYKQHMAYTISAALSTYPSEVHEITSNFWSVGFTKSFIFYEVIVDFFVS